MSAFVHTNDYINLIVNGAKRFGCDYVVHGGNICRRTGDELGRLLILENVKSVEYRYQDGVDADELYGYLDQVYEFAFEALADVDPLVVFAACDSLEYQSCEHPGWEGSEARAWVESIMRSAVRALPNYEAARSKAVRLVVGEL